MEKQEQTEEELPPVGVLELAEDVCLGVEKLVNLVTFGGLESSFFIFIFK